MIRRDGQPAGEAATGITMAASIGPEAGPVPAIAHFVWLGPQLPWFALMAIRSARLRGGFDRIILHHESCLESSSATRELRRLEDVELRVLDETVLFEKLEADGIGSLSKVYAGLAAPAARANMLRLLILALEGGVYLDVDTLTLRNMGELRRRTSAFVGTERIVHPSIEAGATAQRSRLQKQALIVLRTAMSRIGFGWRIALRLQHWYPQVTNNAVIGATERHPFVLGLLADIASMPPKRQRVQYALGPHLIQAALADGNAHGVEILRPEVLFPLGPVVSTHWFRLRRRLPALSEIIEPDTVVVHWYASSKQLRRLLPKCDDAYVRSNRNRQLYSRIACCIVDEELDAELAR